jgi:hypothetical protein
LNTLSGKALDVIGGSLSNGSGIQQWRYLGGSNQQSEEAGWLNDVREDVQHQLAQIVDAAFSTVGMRPHAVQVYEYSLDPAKLTGTVSRLPDISGNRLFTQECRFMEKPIYSLIARSVVFRPCASTATRSLTLQAHSALPTSITAYSGLKT